MKLERLFRRIKTTSIEALIVAVKPVRFPDEQQITAVEVIRLKSEIRTNCDLLLEYVHAVLPAAVASPGRLIILNQLRRDIFEVRSECGKVSVNFLRPKNKRILSRLRAAYEEMRLAAIVVCQQEEPALIDSLTVAL
ncbi:MAG TPA: hypothetical protein VIJ01_17180 [Candidatus Angelobacter sp.]